MKLISLNIWGGIVKEPLLNFIYQHKDTDIFCLQEVYHNAENKISTDDETASLNILNEIQEILHSHKAFFRPVVDGIFGIAGFIKKSITIIDENEIIIHHNLEYKGRGPTHSRNMQWFKLSCNNKTITILNVHGLWNGKGKTDTPERLVQSCKIKQFLINIEGPKLLCGDLNLNPSTESLKIISSGMDDHIELNDITSTRSSLYTKDEKFADYIFTSPDIKVNDFKVLPDEISDHLPLMIDFEI